MSRSAGARARQKAPSRVMNFVAQPLHICEVPHVRHSTYTGFNPTRRNGWPVRSPTPPCAQNCLKMAEEYGRYADLIEARVSDRVPEALAS